MTEQRKQGVHQSDGHNTKGFTQLPQYDDRIPSPTEDWDEGKCCQIYSPKQTTGSRVYLPGCHSMMERITGGTREYCQIYCPKSRLWVYFTRLPKYDDWISSQTEDWDEGKCRFGPYL